MAVKNIGGVDLFVYVSYLHVSCRKDEKKSYIPMMVFQMFHHLIVLIMFHAQNFGKLFKIDLYF